jgi:hypothetical protein
MVEESTAAAHALKGEAQGLATLVDRFKTDDTMRRSRRSLAAVAAD